MAAAVWWVDLAEGNQVILSICPLLSFVLQPGGEKRTKYLISVQIQFQGGRNVHLTKEKSKVIILSKTDPVWGCTSWHEALRINLLIQHSPVLQKGGFGQGPVGSAIQLTRLLFTLIRSSHTRIARFESFHLDTDISWYAMTGKIKQLSRRLNMKTILLKQS